MSLHSRVPQMGDWDSASFAAITAAWERAKARMRCRCEAEQPENCECADELRDRQRDQDIEDNE